LVGGGGWGGLRPSKVVPVTGTFEKKYFFFKIIFFLVFIFGLKNKKIKKKVFF